MAETTPEPALTAIRRLLLLLVTAGLVGTATDLLLIGHDEDRLQFVPLVVIALSLAAIASHVVAGRRWALHAVRACMLALVAAGLTGMVLHFLGNREFQREIDPSIGGLALAWKVLQAKAPPTLAPANLALLGLLGLTYTYRHPLGRGRASLTGG